MEDWNDGLLLGAGSGGRNRMWIVSQNTYGDGLCRPCLLWLLSLPRSSFQVALCLCEIRPNAQGLGKVN